ncbi:MAG TPA: hypothetical protein VLI72_16795 [Methylibium sp.]|nr:hypothetical protein [Methylibium sp.]
MSRAAAGGLARALPVVGVLAIGTLPADAGAARWTLENSFEARAETNDNVTLQPNPPGTVNTRYLSAAMNATRSMENSASRVDATLTSVDQDGGGEDRLDGRLGWSQTLAGPLDTFKLGAGLTQDFNDAVASADVALGRGRRRATTLSGAWSRALSERWSASGQIAWSGTRYGSAPSAGTDFRNTALSGGLSYRVTEVDSVSLQASRSEYRSLDGASRSSSASLDVSVARALSERMSSSLGLGVYRTENAVLGLRRACPLAVSLCEAGIVPWVVYLDRSASTGQGLQYDSSYRYQLSETTSVAFATGSRQTPSGAGTVVRGETLTLDLGHAFSETLTGRAGYASARSRYQRIDGSTRAAQRSIGLTLSKRLAVDVGLEASFEHTRAELPGAGARAHANRVGVSLRFDWPRLDATR